MASLPKGDRKLVQIVDAALADAARRSGHWLVCRRGCTQCCVGTFAINQLDAARLRKGLKELDTLDPKRAESVRRRARSYLFRHRADFPGDWTTGILREDPSADSQFEDFANDEPCPALDPATGTCDVYEHRPMTCRVFGPPVRSGADGGLGVCELCYQGATPEQIADCEMTPDPDDIESELLRAAEKTAGTSGSTIVAFCLAR